MRPVLMQDDAYGGGSSRGNEGDLVILVTIEEITLAFRKDFYLRLAGALNEQMALFLRNGENEVR